jgi:hypothetical protein
MNAILLLLLTYILGTLKFYIRVRSNVKEIGPFGGKHACSV